MADCWLATFRLEGSPAGEETLAAAAPILAGQSPDLAIEVVRGDKGEYAVLISKADDLETPTKLTCLVGFADGASSCNVWRGRGFPLIDATIDFAEDGSITVRSPCFGTGPDMEYETPVLVIKGVKLPSYAARPAIPAVTPAKSEEPVVDPQYVQEVQAPDGAQPDVLITTREVTWSPRRQLTVASKLELGLRAAESRYPSLAPLVKDQTVMPTSVWSGTIDLSATRAPFRGGKSGRVSRAETFGVPAFRFEDVEVLGFRIDLTSFGREFKEDLRKLIEPLNFHLDETGNGSAIPDFRYRAATTTLVIELLRYGKMKQKTASSPLTPDDYQSQHELVVRLLVGRVDDDSAQAHAPAVYVPAVFVDNPWSKTLGRDVQGFDKRMVNFCAGDVRLLPDGRSATKKGLQAPAGPGQAGGQPAEKNRPTLPLTDITRVTLVETTGNTPDHELTVFELNCSPAQYDNFDAFESVDLDLTLSSSSLAGTRWRQSDFDEAEFRRSFARTAVKESVRGFRSVQVSPVSPGPVAIEKAWITGKFAVDDDIRIARPSGVISFTLHAIEQNERDPQSIRPSASSYWNALCRMLGDGKKAEISLPTGSWYRLKCSMDLIIDDGFDFGPEG